MKIPILVCVLALIAAVATAVAIGSPAGADDTRGLAAGIGVFAGLLSIATPLLFLVRIPGAKV